MHRTQVIDTMRSLVEIRGPFIASEWVNPTPGELPAVVEALNRGEWRVEIGGALFEIRISREALHREVPHA